MKWKKCITIVFLIFAGTAGVAQELGDKGDSSSLDEFYELSLEELLNMEVSIASQKALTQRESPGIVSVITGDEIINSGARDLIDVLRLIPGFAFGNDVEGAAGIGVRGNWAHEGKVLLLIDGVESNEILFSTTQFGNHYDVSQIKKIEVIRGPGSSVYGGYAELGVINVITKSASDLNGINVAATYGQLSDTYARRNFSLGIGQEKGDFSYSLKGFMGQGQRSNQTFTDIYGDEGEMLGNSKLDPNMANLNVKYKNLSFRTIYDNYKTTTLPFFDAILPEPAKVDFQSLLSELKYEIKLNEKLKITPKINYLSQVPWLTRDKNDREFYDTNGIYYDIATKKVTGNLAANYNLNENIDFTAGAEYFVESGLNRDTAITDYFINGTNEISFNSLSGYLQAVMTSKIANVTIGGRFINHNQFGSAFSPRIGITKVKDNFHAKLLYSNAFRAPGIENINLNSGISPEKTNVLEMEIGYKVSKNVIIQANVFDITISNPIVYYYDEVLDAESYENFNQSGSRGLEVEAKIKDKWGYLNLNYSYFTTAGKNDVSYYEVPDNANIVVGFPQHRFNMYSSFKVGDNFSVNPSMTFITRRFGFDEVDVDDTSVLNEYKPTTLLNLNLRYKNLLVNGLDLNLAVYDLLNVKYKFIQPYDGYNSPLPGTGREIVLRLTYNLGFGMN